MKHLPLLLALAGLSAAAQAADYSLQAGKDYYQFSRTPQGAGIGLTLDYIDHKDHGSAGGAGLEFALPLGRLTLTGGGKLMALDPDSGSGTAALLGGRASFELAPKISLYGQAYYAPSSFSSGSVDKVSDVGAGVRWNVFGPLAVDAGYRYFDISRSEDSRSRKLADGWYLGAGLVF